VILTENDAAKSGVPSLWLVGLTNLPYGIGVNFVQTTAPFLLSRAGVPVHTIATISAIAWCPLFLSFLWAPIVDLGWKRRHAMVLSGFCTAAALCLATFVLSPRNVVLFTALATLAITLCTFSSAATGALMATLVPVDRRGRAGRWYMVGTMVGGALSAGITMWCAGKFGTAAAALVLAALAAGPSLAALTIAEPESPRVGLVPAARRVHADIAGAFRSRRMLIAMVLLISPVGPGAAANLFSAIAGEYRLSSEATILLTGFSGSVLTALGCLLGGVIADRANRWIAFFGAGLVIGTASILIAVAPRTAPVFLVGATTYLVLSGVANATYTALILETIARGARSAGAQYTWLNNLGNVPVAYMTWLDGQGHRLWGSAGLFAVDGVGNVIPTLLLFLLVARSGVAKMTDRSLEAAAAR
jgi:PAT family beta-lactamase induction signal transducer AmpG